jgi:hypothetical protein
MGSWWDREDIHGIVGSVHKSVSGTDRDYILIDGRTFYPPVLFGDLFVEYYGTGVAMIVSEDNASRVEYVRYYHKDGAARTKRETRTDYFRQRYDHFAGNILTDTKRKFLMTVHNLELLQRMLKRIEYEQKRTLKTKETGNP